MQAYYRSTLTSLIKQQLVSLRTRSIASTRVPKQSTSDAASASKPPAPNHSSTPIANANNHNNTNKPKLNEPNNDSATPKGGRSKWFMAILPLTTFSLGVWQVKRLGWKVDLLQLVDEQQKAPPVSLSSIITRPDIRRTTS